MIARATICSYKKLKTEQEVEGSDTTKMSKAIQPVTKIVLALNCKFLFWIRSLFPGLASLRRTTFIANAGIEPLRNKMFVIC